MTTRAARRHLCAYLCAHICVYVHAPWTHAGERLMYGYMDEQRRDEYENMLDALTRCQQESTRLVLENQELKAQLRAIEKRVAAILADLEDTARVLGMLMRICGYDDMSRDPDS